jgi:O-antigen/teichoic acid export membrane protein
VRFLLSGLAVAVPQFVTFLTTPHLLTALGPSGFGIWVLLQTTVLIAVTSDFGLSSSLARFLAVQRGRHDDAASTRLLVTALLFVATVAGVLDLAIALAGPHVLNHLGLAPAIRASVHGVIGPLCLVIPAAMLSGVAIAAAVAENRFQLVAGVVTISGAAYLVLVLTTVGTIGDLPRLTLESGGQATTVATVLTIAALRHTKRSWVNLLRAEERRELWRYARRLQLVSLAVLINTELDAVVIAVLLPLRDVGVFGIGAAAAAGVRALPLYAIPPIRTTLANTFGRIGRAGTVTEFILRHRQWLALTVPYGLITAVSTPYCVMAWLGRGYGNAGLVATILVVGFGVNVSAAVASTLVQALGIAELESRYSVLSVIVNLALTVPLAIAFGLYGVVAATAIGAAGSTFYFYGLVRASLPELRELLSPSAGSWGAIPVACAVLAAQAGLESAGLSPGAAWLAPALGITLLGLIACAAINSDARTAVKGLAGR